MNKRYNPTKKEKIEFDLKVSRIGRMPSQRNKRSKSDREARIKKLREQTEAIREVKDE